jgi:SAM-dependent methyltransferase
MEMKEQLKQVVKPLMMSSGYDFDNWVRTIMNRECTKLLQEINPAQLNALEISGHKWRKIGFKSFMEVDYPDFDICQDRLPKTFDVIIADQVFEHLLWPYRAGKNVYEMLQPAGYFLVTTPFLIRVHDIPIDCSRWTELGLKYFLAECGFPLEKIQTNSWGNRACVKANFKKWAHQGWFRSQRNEPNFPVSVWALAQK